MKNILEEIVKKIPADYVEIRFEQKKTNQLISNNKNIENLSTNYTSGGFICAYIFGSWNFCSFNLLDDIDTIINTLAEEAKYSSKNQFYFNKLNNDNIIFKIKPAVDTQNISIDEKIDFTKHICKQIISSHKKIQSATCVYQDAKLQKYYINSENRYIFQDLITTGWTISCMTNNGNQIFRTLKSKAHYGGFEITKNIENEIEEITRGSITLLSAESITPGKYKILLYPELGGLLIHEAFGHLVEADNVISLDSKKAMPYGKKIGSEALNILDDGIINNNIGNTYYDDEGVPGQKTVLIKNGRLEGFLHNRETASKMGSAYTGNARAINYRYESIVRMTNTYAEAGNYPFEQMLSSIKEGIFLQGAGGGNCDYGKFSFSSQTAYLIKSGKIVKSLKNLVIYGSILDMLGNIKYIGNEVVFTNSLGGCGKGIQKGLFTSFGSPYLMIEDALVGY